MPLPEKLPGGAPRTLTGNRDRQNTRARAHAGEIGFEQSTWVS